MSNEKVGVSLVPIEASRRLRDMEVLVVAETASRQAELGRVIEQLGCRVTTMDFLQLESLPLEGRAFHLVVADIEREVMPFGGALAQIEPQKVIALIPESLREQGTWIMGLVLGRYVIKPVHPEELLQAVRDRLEVMALQETTVRLSAELRARYQIAHILGISRGAEACRAFVRAFAAARRPLFLSGERGVGKHRIARTLHYSGPWALEPFILVDTTHVPASALSGVLFGDAEWMEGEAKPMGRGVVTVLKAGTIYITEVSLVPLPLQYRVAAVIREQNAIEEGGSEIPVGIRFIFGSHWTPEHLRRKGMLVEDLYEMVRGAHLAIEPLRARPEDIPCFVDYFLERICQRQQCEKRVLTEEARDALARYTWPGNVDELYRVLEIAVQRTSPLPIDATHLPEPIGRPAPRVPKVPFPEEGVDFYELVEEFERGLITEALRRTGGNQRRAARLLRLKETTLAAMRKRLKIA